MTSPYPHADLLGDNETEFVALATIAQIATK